MEIIVKITEAARTAAISSSSLFFIIAGFYFMTGDEATGKKRLLWVCLGLLVVVSSEVLKNAILNM